ncbi:Protein kinase-like (PK-like) [Glarea lozoyensis ATCC 20868]|uniref:Protein kinase-like (PK-like) n=1 Tax=Glarea lozoyensis (strain ATCC 20868 / MF5171) TaxID=1116229 RepID=S3DAS4_GLAL2|nr:Protein kinase-like (PK-like) [Glarea lozoyensis ATCC 20868]EPE35572.1 Protein kinase-like (PK-like) [Glarea lozoyensis ATCC 20868]
MQQNDTAYALQTAAEIERLRFRINDEAVCKHASSLNGGRNCHIEYIFAVGPGDLMGSANYHARICFHDGSPSWLLRVPRVASFAVGLPSLLVEYLVLSEYATLKFLETTAVPAPRAFSYGICGTETDHGIGVSFIIMEELQGKPWAGQGIFSSRATENDKATVWRGLANILVKLEKYPFPKAGSLCLQSSEIEVSAMASDRFLVLTPRGPFATSIAYYTAFAEQYLELIADGQLYTDYPVDAYLAYRFLKDNAVQLASLEGHQSRESFYLKHVDDRGDHILVDDQLNITGIIDWQMACTVPRHEAFGPSLVTADMNAFCDGEVQLSHNDLVLADMLRARGFSDLDSNTADEKVRRFFWGLALEPEWACALPLANAILKTFGVVQEWLHWKESALEEYGSDERLTGLIGRSSQMK